LVDFLRKILVLLKMGFSLWFFKCISYWPEDGKPYVALGRILGKQSKSEAARAVYEKGCQATQGENPYVWQVRDV
jgi:hypothetical protein